MLFLVQTDEAQCAVNRIKKQLPKRQRIKDERLYAHWTPTEPDEDAATNRQPMQCDGLIWLPRKLSVPLPYQAEEVKGKWGMRDAPERKGAVILPVRCFESSGGGGNWDYAVSVERLLEFCEAAKSSGVGQFIIDNAGLVDGTEMEVFLPPRPVEED